MRRFAAQFVARRNLSQTQDRDHPERSVQDEDPPPRGEVGDDAAEYRAHDRARHDRRPPYRQHATVVVLGVDVEENCLRQWLDDAGGGTLDQAKQDQRGWRWRDRAEQRGENEDSDGAGERLPSTVTTAEPTGQRSHHRRGAKIARHHPGAEIDPATQALLELRQSHVCDRTVESLHRGGDHQSDGRLPPA